MTRLRAVVVVTAFALAVTAANAQSPVYERILIPIALPGQVSGAFGSIWMAEVKAHATTGTVKFAQFDPCLACLPVFGVAAGATVDLPVGRGKSQSDPPGWLVYLDRSTPSYAQLSVRISDMSRQALTWGTEIPIVRERDFRTESLTLFNVPIDARFRQALRVYDVDSRVGTIFQLLIENDVTGQLLVDDTRIVAASPVPGETSRIPSALEITSLVAAYPVLAAAERVRVTVIPVNPGTRFWAFVSVTNNETQHVTLITPQL